MPKPKSASQKHLSSPLKLAKQTVALARDFRNPLAGIVGVYAAVDLVFGNGATNLNSVVSSLNDSNAVQHSSRLAGAFDGFGRIISGSGASNTSSSLIPNFILILEALVVLWTVRQLTTGKQVSVKDAYYRSMRPLVPFVLTLGVVTLQLLPLALGSLLLVSVFAGSPALLVGIGSTVLFLALGAWSVQMLSSSLLALCEVTLPDQTPLQALRSTHKLVKSQRWQVALRLLALPIVLFASLLVVLIPLILIFHGLVPIVFYGLSILALPFSTIYIYLLYQELLP